MENESKLVSSVCVYSDDSKEKHMAVEYLKNFGLQVNCFSPLQINGGNLWQNMEFFLQTNLIKFSNSRKESLHPCLQVSKEWISTHLVPEGVVYLSFSGIKSFLREFLLYKKIGKPKLIFDKHKINTFYPNDKYITCFDKKGCIVFEGNIEKAPHKLLVPLAEHDFSGWHDVGSWEIGSLDELCEKRNNSGFIFDRETGTVLFDDDVEKLKTGKTIPVLDSRCCMEVNYASYYNNKGTLYMLYAYMLD